jgi:hypothetical protein
LPRKAEDAVALAWKEARDEARLLIDAGDIRKHLWVASEGNSKEIVPALVLLARHSSDEKSRNENQPRRHLP